MWNLDLKLYVCDVHGIRKWVMRGMKTLKGGMMVEREGNELHVTWKQSVGLSEGRQGTSQRALGGLQEGGK